MLTNYVYSLYFLNFALAGNIHTNFPAIRPTPPKHIYIHTSASAVAHCTMEYLASLRELTRDVFWLPTPEYTENDYPDLTGKVYVVTGGSSGIGFESAKLLLSKGARVYITGRTPAKIEHALTELGKIGDVRLLGVHSDDLATVAPAVQDLCSKETKLHGVLHNAGTNYRGQNVLEPYGLLDIIVINVFAAQLLQKLLLPLLEATPGSRTVWVTSSIHYYAPPQGIVYTNGFSSSMNDFDGGGYLGKGNGMYGQTKAMNIFQAVQFGKRFPNVVSVAVHPGAITSDIRRYNSWRGLVLGSISRPTVMGAYAVLEPMLNPKVTTENNGAYYIPFGQEGRVRPDVRAAAEGERGNEFWDWINGKIKNYE